MVVSGSATDTPDTDFASVGSGKLDMFKVLRRGTAGAFAVQVGGAGLGLVSHVVLARFMGAKAYGTYTLVLTWISVLVVLALAGQSSAVLRFIPAYVHHQRWGQLRGLRRRVRLVVFVASAVVALMGATLVYVLRARLGPDLELTFMVAFVLLIVLTQLQMSGALHCALKRAASAGGFNNLVRPLLLLGLVLGFTLGLGHRLGAPEAMLASTVGALGALALSDLLLKRVWPRESRRARPHFETGAWLRLGGHLFFLAIVGTVLARVDILVLGAFANAASVGPYYAAVQLAALAAYGLSSVNTILAPMIAERYAARDHKGLRELVRRAAWLTFSMTVTIALATAIAGPWILQLFGPGFGVAYVPLLIVLAGQCVNALAGPVGLLMTMTRFERQAPQIIGGGAAANVLLSAVLVPQFGMLGAAVATATSTAAWNVGAFVFVWGRLGVNPTILPLPNREIG